MSVLLRYLFIVLSLSIIPLVSYAGPPIIEITIRDHLFHPAEIRIGAHQKVKLLIHNQDASPEEFESYELNREKVIPGNSKAIIFIGPLAPGEYVFFGEFNPKTAQGKIISVQD